MLESEKQLHFDFESVITLHAQCERGKVIVVGVHICDRIWEKGPYRAFKKNRVITTVGKSRL